LHGAVAPTRAHSAEWRCRRPRWHQRRSFRDPAGRFPERTTP